MLLTNCIVDRLSHFIHKRHCESVSSARRDGCDFVRGGRDSDVHCKAIIDHLQLHVRVVQPHHLHRAEEEGVLWREVPSHQEVARVAEPVVVTHWLCGEIESRVGLCCEGGGEGGREGGRERRREGGREGKKKGVREGGREGKKKGGREGGRDGNKKGGKKCGDKREGRREGGEGELGGREGGRKEEGGGIVERVEKVSAK